ncbi:MAG: M20 family metallopeptidase [Chloroflexota bacterium]
MNLNVDRSYLVEVASRLCKVPTNVELGYDTLMEADDPKLVHYIQEAVRPELERIGAPQLIDAGNNLVAAFGPAGTGRSLLFQSYCVSQHHNLMEDPFSGKVESAAAYGFDEPAVFGMGVSQNKAHQAVLLAVFKLLIDTDAKLSGRLYWSVNCEGRSSHDCTAAILAALPETPSFCIVQYGSGLRMSLGNRGRVDVSVHIRGKSTHSSTPQAGLSAIEGANEVMNRLKTLTWPDKHSILGGRQAIVYKLAFEPLAPHTLPSDAYLTIDRRLLPGEEPEVATNEIRRRLGDLSPYELAVETGVYMLPALVPADESHVRAFQDANRAVRGHPADEYHHGGTYDAGGTASAGIPTVMFGAACPAPGLTGVDFVTVADMETEANVLAQFVLTQLAEVLDQAAQGTTTSTPGGAKMNGSRGETYLA